MNLLFQTLLSCLFQFGFGMWWYGSFLMERWLAAAGLKAEDIGKEQNADIIYIIPIVFSITTTFLIRAILSKTKFTVLEGVKWSLALWSMVLFPGILHHNAFQDKLELAFIDCGKDLFCFLVTGIIVGGTSCADQCADKEPVPAKKATRSKKAK